MGTRYMIISKPAYIRFQCPHCKQYVEILFQDADYNTESWLDGAFCTCPACEKDVELVSVFAIYLYGGKLRFRRRIHEIYNRGYRK